MPLPRDIVLLIDTREKKPLEVPATIAFAHPEDPARVDVVRIHKQIKELKTGDYAIAGCEAARLIERKGGAREIVQNIMTGDVKRFTAALDRLASACALPLLFLEGHPSELLSDQPWAKDPYRGIDILMRMCDDRGITLEIIPCATMIQRRAAGEWLVRRLVNGSISHYARETARPVLGEAPPVVV